ncbi:MAG TPA: preQ(1) synthase [Candidatus Limnocylindria bacterium]|nr:preQ(1) synthase [Candidatus Limnocylindria bacterium]
MIAESALEAVPNPNPERDYEIDLSIPEFTCLCPRSNFPDFATIRIHYVPDQSIVELKSLKLYINQFRDQELFHEQAINRILDDLVALIQPRLMEVVWDFNVRGNIKTVVTARHPERLASPNGA